MVSFWDYVRYFFTGYKTESMDASLMAILRTVQFLALVFLGKLLTSVIDSLTSGTFTLEWESIRSYILPAVLAVLILVNEMIRKFLEPSVSLKALPQAAPAQSVQQSVGRAVPLDRPPVE